MSQYRCAPRRNPAATFDDGTAQQYSYSCPRRRPHPGMRPYTIIDEETGERYYVNAEAPPNPSSAHYSFRPPPPPRRRVEISDGREYYRGGYSYSDHNRPIQTISSDNSPPTLSDVVLEEVARLIPSLVDLGIAKLRQMRTRIDRETQRPEPEMRVIRQENELQARWGNNQNIERDRGGRPNQNQNRVNQPRSGNVVNGSRRRIMGNGSQRKTMVNRRSSNQNRAKRQVSSSSNFEEP